MTWATLRYQVVAVLYVRAAKDVLRPDFGRVLSERESLRALGREQSPGSA